MFDESKIGHSFPPFHIEVERGKIHELTQAIGDDNPLYASRDAAIAAGYKDVPLSPTAPTIFTFWGNTQALSQMAEAGINVMRILHGEEQYEYLSSIYPGDTLTGVTTLVDGRTRMAGDGSSMDIVTTETQYTNQNNETVLKAKTMFVIRNEATEQENDQ